MRTIPRLVSILALCAILVSSIISCGGGGEDGPPSLGSPPVADAGPDQNVTTGNLVTMDAGNSYDPDPNDKLTYNWELFTPPGSSSLLTGSATKNPAFTPDVDGEYILNLYVQDAIWSDSDQVIVRASSGNSAPVADAGTDQIVTTGNPVTLDGSNSTGNSLTYSWTITTNPGTATLTGAATDSPSFTPDVSGTYVIELVVNDGTQDSEPDTVSVTANIAPVADAGIDRSVDTGSEVTLDGSGSYDDDVLDNLTYSWTITTNPGTATLTGADTDAPTFTPDADGIYVIELVVNDGKESSVADTVSITATTPADTIHFDLKDFTEEGIDPTITAYYSLSDSWTRITLTYGIDKNEFTLMFNGQSKGNYTTIGVTSNAVFKDKTNNLSYYDDDLGLNTYAGITVTEYGAEGGRIKGTYAVTLCEIKAITADTCNQVLNRETYSGSFNVMRDPDSW